MDFKKLAYEINAINEEKGWNSLDRRPLEIIALIHSEISEATEQVLMGNSPVWYGEGGKPEGEYVEIIDAIIRTLGYLGNSCLDIFNGAKKYAPFQHLFSFTRKKDNLRAHAYLHYLLSQITEDVRGDGHDMPAMLFRFVIVAAYYLTSRFPEIDIDEAIKEKIGYNKTRPFRHGKVI